MKQNIPIKWVFILTSALLYPIAFYYAHTFFWISFLYLVPIFYMGVMQRVTWQDGYLWGVCALSAHEFFVLIGLYGMATGPWYECVVPLGILALFRALFPALWFFGTTELLKLFHKPTLEISLSVWVMTAWVYEIWMDWFHLWPCGKCEGYIFFNPLIPLAAYPPLLFLLSYVCMPVLLLYLFACSGMITYAALKKTWGAWLLVLGMLSVWTLGFFMQPEPTAPAWMRRLGVLQQKFLTDSEMPSVMVLQDQCLQLKERYPSIDCVICPESCIYEPDLPLHFKAYAGQYDNILETIDLIIGGFDEDGSRNTAYHILNNHEVYKFYKRHAMPLTERMPPIFDMALVRDLYFSMRPQIAPSPNMRPLWVCAGQVMSPYICSELFFNATPDDYYPGTTILAVCNDTWAPPAAQYVMYLGALFRAIEWQRDVIYVSYYYAALISKTGAVYPLQTLDSED